MKDKSPVVDEVIDAVRENPKAAAEVDSLKDAMKELAHLRAAGVAKGAAPLKAPHSGRYDDPPRPTRITVLDRKKRAPDA